jgi:hypothetical protein
MVPSPPQAVEIAERQRLTAEERRRLLEHQGYVCAACPTNLTVRGREEPLFQRQA